MSWASFHIEKLLKGETVQFRPHGNSMQPAIESGQLCTVEPIKNHDDLEPGDIVLCKVNGKQYLHLIQARRDKQFCIGNNKGHTNGWITAKSIYGKCIKVEK
jgi:phage repressor protein C with HTH and peptisase S24 domain